MDKTSLVVILEKLMTVMIHCESELTQADARFGDGDLGISMKKGFEAAHICAKNTDETDLGKIFLLCSNAFNEAAPSTLGTILSLCLMGMAKELKGKTNASLEEMAYAMEQGVNTITLRTNSHLGDRTILDSLIPAINTLKNRLAEGKESALTAAFEAARKGVENTKNLPAKFGRMVYYGDQVLGYADGGAIVGMLIFKTFIH